MVLPILLWVFLVLLTIISLSQSMYSDATIFLAQNGVARVSCPLIPYARKEYGKYVADAYEAHDKQFLQGSLDVSWSQRWLCDSGEFDQLGWVLVEGGTMKTLAEDQAAKVFEIKEDGNLVDIPVDFEVDFRKCNEFLLTCLLEIENINCPECPIMYEFKYLVKRRIEAQPVITFQNEELAFRMNTDSFEPTKLTISNLTQAGEGIESLVTWRVVGYDGTSTEVILDDLTRNPDSLKILWISPHKEEVSITLRPMLSWNKFSLKLIVEARNRYIMMPSLLAVKPITLSYEPSKPTFVFVDSTRNLRNFSENDRWLISQSHMRIECIIDDLGSPARVLDGWTTSTSLEMKRLDFTGIEWSGFVDMDRSNISFFCNVGSGSSAEAHFQIAYGPKSVQINVTKYKESDELGLTCLFNSNPFPLKVTWLRQLPSGITYHLPQTGAFIKIPNGKVDSYQCNVTNPFSNHSSSSFLNFGNPSGINCSRQTPLQYTISFQAVCVIRGQPMFDVAEFQKYMDVVTIRGHSHAIEVKVHSTKNDTGPFSELMLYTIDISLHPEVVCTKCFFGSFKIHKTPINIKFELKRVQPPTYVMENDVEGFASIILMLLLFVVVACAVACWCYYVRNLPEDQEDTPMQLHTPLPMTYQSSLLYNYNLIREDDKSRTRMTSDSSGDTRFTDESFASVDSSKDPFGSHDHLSELNIGGLDDTMAGPVTEDCSQEVIGHTYYNLITANSLYANVNISSVELS